MYTQHSRITGPPLADGKHRTAPVEDGPTVRLIAQNGDGRVLYADASGDVESLASDEFFATHREAGPAEIEDYEKGGGARRRSARAEPAKT